MARCYRRRRGAGDGGDRQQNQVRREQIWPCLFSCIAGDWNRTAMTLYFLVKYLHVVGAIVILGTGTGIAFFMLMAHRTAEVAFIARTAAIVVIADMIFTLSAVILQPISGGLLMMLSQTGFTERWLLVSLALYALAGAFWIP